MSELAHSIYGASGAKRWLECPGSIWLSQGIEEKTSNYAAAGSGAHFLSECMQRDRMTQQQALDLLETDHPDWYEAMEDTSTWDDHWEAIYVYTDWMQKMIDENPQAKVFYEVRTNLGFIHPKMFGTADFALANLFGILDVADYKHGKGVTVEVDDNPQAAFYTLGVAHRFAYNFEGVRSTIIQPRASHVEGGVRSGEIIPMEDFRLKWTEIFSKGIERVEEAKTAKRIDNYLNPGDHCGFCKARATCPAIRKRTYELAQMDFDPITLDDSQTEGAQLPEPKTLTVPQLRLVLDHAEMIDKWIKAVNEHAQSLLEANEVKPKDLGYKLVNKRPTRKYVDPKKVLTSLKRRKNLTEDDYMTERKLLSPAQLEKRIKREHPKVWEAMQPHIHKVSSGKTMAKEDDKRPALEHKKAADDFDSVEAKGSIDIPG